MDQAAVGAKALEDKNYQKAIEHYTKAIAAHPKAVDYYIKRSTAYTRLALPNNLLSLLDAETAVVLARERGKRELIGQAQLRRGVALFGSERYADAGQCFEWAQKQLPKDNSLSMWFARVESKSKGISASDDRSEVRVKEVPDVDMDGVLKKAVVAIDEPAAAAKVKEGGLSSESRALESQQQHISAVPQKIRHEWYQSTSTVTITLLAKGVDKERAVVDIHPGSLSITFPLPTGSEYDFSIDPFYAAVDAAASSYKVMSTKVEVVLKKANAGQKWHSLEGTSPIFEEKGISGEKTSIPQTILSDTHNSSGPAYPTSSKHGPKDWDRLATNLTKNSKKAKDKNDEPEYDSDEGGDPVNAFFKKLYKDASPETQRAMVKSYQESNGTALSTNWSEVSKGTVETTPPDGMEAKKW